MSVANIRTLYRAAISDGLVKKSEAQAIVAEARKHGVTSHERGELMRLWHMGTSSFTPQARSVIFAAAWRDGDSRARATEGAAALTEWIKRNADSVEDGGDDFDNTASMIGRVADALAEGEKIQVRRLEDGSYGLLVPLYSSNSWSSYLDDGKRAVEKMLLERPELSRFQKLPVEIRLIGG